MLYKDMYYLGLDGHDFISDRLNDFTTRFDWTICNNTIIKSAAAEAAPSTTPRTICMKTDFLPKYADLLSTMGQKTGGGFVLLTCSSMYSPAYHYPEETRRILENPHLVAWFSENNTMAEGGVSPHPKMRHFPSGFNFHDAALQAECERELLAISAENAAGADVPPLNFLYCPPQGRDLLNDNYCKTFCGISRNLMRGEPFFEISWSDSVMKSKFHGGSKNLCEMEDTLVNDVDVCYIGANNPTAHRSEQYRDYYNILKNYKFLICPHEATIDPSPPRIWEALALGVIPVMLYNPLSEALYRGFPIWFVQDWREILSPMNFFNHSPEIQAGGLGGSGEICALRAQISTDKYRELMRKSPYSAHQLSADYWFDRINRTFMGMSPEALAAANMTQPTELLLSQKKQVSFYDTSPSDTAIPPKIVFAFCIYGDNLMYYDGLRENIRIISREFGDEAHVLIYAGKSAILSNISVTPRTTIIRTGHDGVINMIYRYSGLLRSGTDLEFYFVRDADSIIGDRDLWCIRDFMDNCGARATAHIIRDHYHHKSKLTGGLTGFTRLGISLVAAKFSEKIAEFKEGDYGVYGNDEQFLNEHIYPLLFAQAPIVHSNFCVMPGEIHRPILAPNTLTNFCGNVRQIAPFPHFQFLYNDFDINMQWKFSETCGAYELFIQTILSLKRSYDIATPEELDPRNLENLTLRLYAGLKQLPYSSRSRTIAYLIEAYLRANFIEGCYAAYQLYAYCEVHERARELMWDVIAAQTDNNPVLFMTSGCTDGSRALKDYGIAPPIIVYGAYADDWTAYPCAKMIHRNVWYYEKDRAECLRRGIPFEWVENVVWAPVKQIYVMGLDIAPDRIYETKQELARVGISLDKIHSYLAKKDADKNGAYLGATKNHADVLGAAAATTGGSAATDVVLFLEDDFVFSGDPTERLMEFWQRQYDYDLCLLAASKMHERAELDDLISYSKQYCTTSSAYFVPVGSLEQIAALVREGYEKMKETGDTVTYCVDRYWTKIQPAYRMILFREKLGFQRPSMSKITGALNAMLD